MVPKTANCCKGKFAPDFFRDSRSVVQRQQFLLDVFVRLKHMFWLAQIAPVIFVGTKRSNYLSRSCQPQIGSDDGKDAILGQHWEESWRDDVDAGKCQRGHRFG